MNRIKTYTIILLGIALLATVAILRHEIGEKQRYKRNTTSLLRDVVLYRTKDSLNALSVDELVLTKKELKQQKEELVGRIKSLGIKLKRLEAYTQVGTKTEVVLKEIIRDSVRPGTIDTVRCIDFQNNYISVQGCDDDGIRITVIDTLDQIIHRVPRKFLFIKFGTKAIRQEIISRNPYTKFSYSTYIKLKK